MLTQSFRLGGGPSPDNLRLSAALAAAKKGVRNSSDLQTPLG